MRINEIEVVEQFLSFQGEGPSAGTLAWFYRLAGCNLGCAECDSKFAWAANLLQKAMYPEEYFLRLFVITGGEPLWDKNRVKTELLIKMLCGLYGDDMRIEIETNGTQKPLKLSKEYEKYVMYIVSPKLKCMGIENGIDENILKSFVLLNAIFKFVVYEQSDILAVNHIVETCKIPVNKVWIMPKGVEVEDILSVSKMISNEIKKYGYNYSPRLHRMVNFQ